MVEVVEAERDGKWWFEETALEFVECPTCAAKPGSPTLCNSCLQNRSVIGRLHDIIAKQDEALNLGQVRRGEAALKEAEDVFETIVFHFKDEGRERVWPVAIQQHYDSAAARGYSLGDTTVSCDDGKGVVLVRSTIAPAGPMRRPSTRFVAELASDHTLDDVSAKNVRKAFE